MSGRGRWRTSRFSAALALVAVAGFVGRVAFLYLSRKWQLGGDGYAYRIEAARLVDGQVQGSLHPPAWTFVMAIPPALGFEALRYQQVLAALIGTATIVMTGLAGKSAFGPRVGLIAAGLAAVYPNIWLYEREVLSEPLAMLLVATLIWAAFGFRARPGLGGAVGLGALVGLAALSRSELIFTSLAILVPVILSRAAIPWRRRLAWLAAAGIACVVPIVPWAAFNATRYDRPVPLSSGMGPAMRAGNCPPTYRGPKLGYYEFGCVVLVRDVSPDPSIADRQLRDKAVDFMKEDAGRAVLVAAARVGRSFDVYRPFQQARFETERGTKLWLTRTALFAYWALVPFAVGGAIVARRRRVALYPLLACPVIVVFAVLPTIGAVRYRAIAEIPLVILSAVALDALTRRRSEPEDRATPTARSVADGQPDEVHA